MEDETLDALTALYNAYPKTQYVDYSGFIDAFQPVLNDPSMYVPQQGLLQNTPTLAEITLDPVVTGLLQAYPQMEQDFQSSFAVDPNTYRNFETYKRLPFDKAYWEGVVGRGGSGGDGLDLGGVDAAGTVASTIVDSDPPDDPPVDPPDIIKVDGDDGIDTSTTSGTVTVTSTGGTGSSSSTDTQSGDVTVIDTTESDTTLDDGSSSGDVTVIDTSLDDTTLDDGLSTSGQVAVTNLDGSSSTSSTDSSESGTSEVTDTTLETTKNNATNTIIDSLYATGNISATDLDTVTNAINASTTVSGITGIVENAFTAAGQQIPIGSILSSGGTNLISSTTYSPNFGFAPKFLGGVDAQGNLITKMTYNPDFTSAAQFDVNIEPSLLDNFLDNPINQGFGEAGTAFNDATQFTGAEAISLGGGLLSLASALDEATPSNVYGTISGTSASGLLGNTMQTAFTQPWVAPLAVGLFIAEKLQPDPSNKTGFAQFDAGTGETTSFGMEGDKYKEKNVEASTSIASAMGGAVNNITSAFGLTAKGDILAQTGNRDPLNITYGNQESEATLNDRLNYNTETGDIINSNDDIQRWYYTGKGGADGAKLTSDLVHGTALLSLKAKANGEDSIDLANMTLPARSADDVMRGYMSLGYDELMANALTGASQNPSTGTVSLLGSLLQPNTTNEANYLTDTERTSLLEQGYTNEQLDTMLYGTTENSLLAINELLANTEENENNEENI